MHLVFPPQDHPVLLTMDLTLSLPLIHPSYLFGSRRRPEVDSAQKEGPRINLPELPQPIDYRGWVSAVTMEVAAVANRDDPDEVARWLHRVFRPGATMKQLGDSHGFGSRDLKLAAAIMRIAKGDLAARIALEAERHQNQLGRILKGRQCLLMVCERYRLDERCGALYNISDLISVLWLGDSHMADFLADGTMCWWEWLSLPLRVSQSSCSSSDSGALPPSNMRWHTTIAKSRITRTTATDSFTTP